MLEITLRDILANARKESSRMQHYFLGVEHLFIGLIELQGGITSSILAEYGLTADYVVDAIRRKVGKGSQHRLWPGMPYSPRAQRVLDLAEVFKNKRGHDEVDERDVLLAIFEEGSSIPVRVLTSLRIDINDLKKTAQNYQPAHRSQPPIIGITFGSDFDSNDSIPDEQSFILRRMFAEYAQIRVERRLEGGFSPAHLFVITPIHADGREDSPTVVKIDQADAILDEARRYNTHVRATLPPLTARLIENPTAPDISELAGLKYTLVTDLNRVPTDLRSAAQNFEQDDLGSWIKGKLYPYFGRTWWQQRQSFRFQVWHEYDWLLPPILTLDVEHISEDDIPANTHTLRVPIDRHEVKNLQYGDIVIIENFTVQKLDKEHRTMRLAAGHGVEAVKRAYRIEIRDIDIDNSTYYRGEVIERLVGKVWETRNDTLLHAIRDLEPEFDINADFITVNDTMKLPNPLLVYEQLLDMQINGSWSKIHGDLHLGNILIGPENSPWLIDFANARDGHTLFDWATLEIGLLDDVIMAKTDGSWDAAYQTLFRVSALHKLRPNQSSSHTIVYSTSSPIAAIREIVADCLENKQDWSEYFVALAFCSLRAITWKSISLGGKRLMYLLAAYAIQEILSALEHNGDVSTEHIRQDKDVTDYIETHSKSGRKNDRNE